MPERTKDWDDMTVEERTALKPFFRAEATPEECEAFDRAAEERYRQAIATDFAEFKARQAKRVARAREVLCIDPKIKKLLCPDPPGPGNESSQPPNT